MVRVYTTIMQKRKAIGFMEDFPKLARKQYNTIVARFFWRDLKNLLNRYGPARSTKTWRKLWSTWKSCALKRQRQVESGERVGLSDLDQRIVHLLQTDGVPLENVQVHLQYMPALPPPADYERDQDVAELELWADPLPNYAVSRYSGAEIFIDTDY